MGYACPVCEDPQADAGHLANHLAITAILGDDAHEAWLDTHATKWGSMDESELAVVVVDHVEETEFPQVFEDTVGALEDPTDPVEERSGMLFEEDSDRVRGHDPSRGTPPLDEDAAEILEEAREMTRRMLDDDEE